MSSKKDGFGLTDAQKKILDGAWERGDFSIFASNPEMLFSGKKKYKKEIQFEEKKKENNIQFTLDQVKDILEDIHFDDFPFDSRMPLEEKLEIFNHMPQLLQGDCIKWGANDTEVRSEIGEWLLRTQLNMNYDEYWKSDIFKEYCDTPFGEYEYVKIDLEKFYV
jgi:hypothetical protein